MASVTAFGSKMILMLLVWKLHWVKPLQEICKWMLRNNHLYTSIRVITSYGRWQWYCILIFQSKEAQRMVALELEAQRMVALGEGRGWIILLCYDVGFPSV